MTWLLVAWLLATTAVASESSTLLRVEVQPTPVLAVRLNLSTPVTPVIRTLPASDTMPDRIYLDLPATTLGDGALRVTPGAGALLRVRTGQFDPATARVVLDLTLPRSYVVHRAAGSITIELADGAPPQPPSPPPPPPPSPSPPPAPREEPPPRLQEALPRDDAPPRDNVRPQDELARRAFVVIDAGHGGRDPGATGIDGVMEKTVTLALAKRLAERLPARLSADVLLTRTADAFVPIDRRIAMAADAALFISLHANASLDPRVGGIEVFFGGGDARPVADGGPPMRLGLAVIEALEARLGDVSTLVRPGEYGVLARNSVPSVLVEIGYLTNPVDAGRIRDQAYRELVVEAVIDAVDAFLHERVAS
jgi:N-acetylmuramoyl-L-alanine amidase